jgi:hypothetical protein
MRLAFSLVIVTLVSLIASERAFAAEFPKGTFTLKDKDVVWAVTFDGKGKFSVTRDGKEAVMGSYKVTKDELEITDEAGPQAATGDTKTAVYKWKLDGKKLSFTKVKDEAGGRAAVVTAGPWELKE